MLVLAGLIVAMLLFSAWQHFEIVRDGYSIEELRDEARPRKSRSTGKLRLEPRDAARARRSSRSARDASSAAMPPPTEPTRSSSNARPSASTPGDRRARALRIADER